MTTPNPLTPISTRLGIPDGDPDVMTGAILREIERLQAESDPDYRNPEDVAEIDRLKLQLRSRPTSTTSIPADYRNPADVEEIDRLKKAIEKEDFFDKLWTKVLYGLVVLAVIFAVILFLKSIPLGGVVFLCVAGGLVWNINTSKQKWEGPATLLSVAVPLIYAFYLLMSTLPATPPTNPDGTRQPADQQPVAKSEAEKLRDLLSGTKAGTAIDFPVSLYNQIERKGNTVRMPKLVGVDANYALLTGPKSAVTVKEGAPNVTVDGEYLVYTSPADPTSYRIYLDPIDQAKLPSASRPLPASK